MSTSNKRKKIQRREHIGVRSTSNKVTNNRDYLRLLSGDEPPPAIRGKELAPLTEAQHEYVQSIKVNTLTFGIGPAGSGKTFVAASLAGEAIASGQTRKIIVTRPTVEVGKTLGFLPGTLAEKFDPYIAPVRDVLRSTVGPGAYGYNISHGKIEPIPLELMRGSSFDDCWILLDEAQNTTAVQMKMFLTRIGVNTKVVINGDPDQSDLPHGVQSGLVDALDRFSRYPDIGVVEFDTDDCVRSDFVKRILEGYSRR